MGTLILKALASFSTHFENETGVKHLLQFCEGDLIYDERIADHLLNLGCPVAAVSDRISVACPRCRMMFNSTQHLTSATSTLVNASIQHNGQFFSFSAGEIVKHEWLIAALREASIPLEEISAVRCPKCATVFR